MRRSEVVEKLAELFLAPGQIDPNDMYRQLDSTRETESGVLAYLSVSSKEIEHNQTADLRKITNNGNEALKEHMLKDEGFFGLLNGGDLDENVRVNMEKFCFEQITTQHFVERLTVTQLQPDPNRDLASSKQSKEDPGGA